MRKLATIQIACVVFLALAWAQPSVAQDEYPPDVEGEEEEVGGATEGDGLPATGANLMMFAVTGVIGIGTGIFIVSRTRRRRNADE